EPLSDNGDGTNKDQITMSSSKVWSILKATGTNGYSTMISKITEEVFNSKVGDIDAQIDGLKNLGNLNVDHAFGATIGGVKKVGGAAPGVRPGFAALNPGESLQFDWTTPLGFNDILPEILAEDDDHNPDDPAGTDDPNFGAFKLAFFEPGWHGELTETS